MNLRNIKPEIWNLFKEIESFHQKAGFLKIIVFHLSQIRGYKLITCEEKGKMIFLQN